MTATTTVPTVTPELKRLLRRVKLGRTLDALPERLSLARSSKLSHAEFLELVLADEVERRDRASASLRSRKARLDPAMTIHTWDGDAQISYDHDIWAELTSLRFVNVARCAFLLGPVGSARPTSPTPWATSPSPDATRSWPCGPTSCSTSSRPPGWTTATTSRSAGSPPWTC